MQNLRGDTVWLVGTILADAGSSEAAQQRGPTITLMESPVVPLPETRCECREAPNLKGLML
jgi:hypothetical protein